MDFMKKRFLMMLSVVAALSVLPGFAVEPRAVTVNPRIEFIGATATCYVTVMADNASDEVEAEICLKQGNRTVGIWYEEVRGILIFEDAVNTERGKTYTLYVDVAINGVEHPTISRSKTNN